MLLLGVILAFIGYYIPNDYYVVGFVILIVSYFIVCLSIYKLAKGNVISILLFFLLFFVYGSACSDKWSRCIVTKQPECFKVIASVSKRSNNRYGCEVYCFYDYKDSSCISSIKTDFKKYYSVSDYTIVIIERKHAQTSIIDWNPSSEDIQHFSKAVYYSDADKELGNDYYYYAKLRPDLALKNFGLNKLTLGKDNLLYYKNVNDSIDSQVHQCADSLQSQLNRDMLDTADAFYFHGEIIQAEKVFSEITKAREYYERYCGK